ncbi:hypothetical protein GCM10010170_078620 [Dactylosporangium salmoneum]|uniref:Uncharacterized protein n=1 Tax=Dactylosporangium salmoneum TaxID=53361 RepID=A0ABN3HBP3_9ACTN
MRGGTDIASVTNHQPEGRALHGPVAVASLRGDNLLLKEMLDSLVSR